MSFTDDSGLGQVPDFGGDQSQTDPGNQPSQQEIPLSGYAQNFLESKVPAEHRDTVKPYIREWDNGFNQYSQRVQGELKRYKDLGDPDTLATAHGVYQRIVNDPQGVAQYLYDNGYAPTMKEAKQQAAAIENQQNPEIPDITAHPEWQKLQTENQRIQRALGLVAQQMQERRQQEEAAKAEAELDQMLAQIKGQNPGISERFVLAHLHSGVTDPAVIGQEWKAALQSATNTQRAGQPSPAPNLMGAGTNGPVQQNPANMTEDQRREALLSRINSLGW